MDGLQETEAQSYKEEAIEIEDDPILKNEESPELYTNKEVGNDDTGSESQITKHECQVCEEVFTDETNLKKHKDEYHQDESVEGPNSSLRPEQTNNDEIYKCDYPNCKKTFLNTGGLAMHSKTHEIRGTLKCYYTGCSKTFTKRRFLNIHLRVHNNAPPFKCKHSGCNESFFKQRLLNDHMREHTDEGPFKCNFQGCNKAFKFNYHLTEHLCSHSGHMPFKCNYKGCGKVFKRKSTLVFHQKRTHTTDSDNTKMFDCEYPGCSLSFLLEQSLQNHRRSHYPAGEGTSSGNVCSNGKNDNNGDTTGNNETGVSLEASEVAKMYRCSICEENFSEEAEYQEHVECCGNYFTCEFVDIDQLNEQDLLMLD